jgi:hypothetical protein
VLEDWCPPFAGFFLYYPSRKQQPAALVAVIETFGKLIFSLYLLFIRKEDGKGSTTFTLQSFETFPKSRRRACRTLRTFIRVAEWLTGTAAELLPDPLSEDGARRINLRYGVYQDLVDKALQYSIALTVGNDYSPPTWPSDLRTRRDDDNARRRRALDPVNGVWTTAAVRFGQARRCRARTTRSPPRTA